MKLICGEYKTLALKILTNSNFPPKQFPPVHFLPECSPSRIPRTDIFHHILVSKKALPLYTVVNIIWMHAKICNKFKIPPRLRRIFASKWNQNVIWIVITFFNILQLCDSNDIFSYLYLVLNIYILYILYMRED